MLSFSGVMFSTRRGSGRRIFSALALALMLPALSACAPVVGGGVLVAVVAIGALTSHCYDYIDVSVFDPQGKKTCAATVTATGGGDEFELKSCYYAPLTDGHWTIRARLPGFPDAVSVADVEHAKDCTRHVQSMELTINAPGSAPTGQAPFQASPAPRAPSAPPALPPPPPPPPGGPVTPPGTPPAPPAATPTATPPASSAPPAPSAAPAPASVPPSVGVFPDQGARPSPPK